jgi:hypothetical protein
MAFILLLSSVSIFSSDAQAESVSDLVGNANYGTETKPETDSTKVLTLEWGDLIPFNERGQRPVPRIAAKHDGEDTPAQNLAVGVRDDLDSRTIKIPGFVIPLEGDDTHVTEFLLVPYFGACIHVPPPPLNQIIYVKFKHGAPLQNLWDIVYVTGVIKTETVVADLAQTGYLIEGIEITPYKDKS